MKNILTLLVLTAALSVSACNKKKNEPVTDALPTDQNMGVGMDNVSAEGMPGVNTAAQEELVATAGDRVFFDFDSSSISAEAQATLTKQAQWLAGNNSNVTVEGHCDERGTREYNLALGEKRAQSVKEFLVSQGVSPARISTISYGKEFPEFLGSTEAAWTKNRRGVTVVNN
jgi:peptidoglycan-associated lipoprotein